MLLQRRRGSKADPITEDDVMRAINKLKVLGGGFSVMKVGGDCESLHMLPLLTCCMRASGTADMTLLS